MAATPAAFLGAPLAAFALSHAGQLEAVARVSGGERFDTRLTWETWALAIAGALIAWVAFATPAWFDAGSEPTNELPPAGRNDSRWFNGRGWMSPS